MEKIESKGVEDDKNKALKTEETLEVEDEHQDRDPAITAPQLMVSADGEIIIDESRCFYIIANIICSVVLPWYI